VTDDLNVVLQRLEQPDPRERFDLVIATNVLVYYDVFEQSLALANLAKMLRPGGLLLSNNAVHALPGTPLHAVGDTGVGYTDSRDGDLITWYERP
jgi:predicted TPR repeat methyltransferase